MAFTFNPRKKGDVVVVDMSGPLGAGEPVSLLRNTVRRLMEEGNTKFVLNLNQVSYISTVQAWVNWSFLTRQHEIGTVI